MVRPITQGDRGPAVEDVQKRLLVLGFDLGPTGPDGVFWGATLAAVRRFQQEHRLAEDGLVGDETWAALVDATFRLGDRLLYLRVPYFHGADVRTLQGALNVLGFACGETDGIFGRFTERAVGEFQTNTGLPADGIAGPETIRALERLSHVWQGKDPAFPAALTVAPARAAEALKDARVTLACADDCARSIAERIGNLARATEPAARLEICEEPCDGRTELVLHLVTGTAARGRLPLITVGSETRSEGRFIAAFQAAFSSAEAVVVLPDSACAGEQEAQSVAVRVLDGICAVLSDRPRPVVP